MEYEEAKKAFCKTISQMSGKYGATSIFADAVAMMACSIQNACRFRQDLEDKYLNIAKRYGKEELTQLARLLGLISRGLTDKFGDFLGECYMGLDMGNKYAGQFFTPYHISHFCAKITIGDEKDAKKIIEEEGFFTICEPTCGSGGMIVAAVEDLKDKGINFQRDVLVYASDIDHRCAHMCYITLSLLGVPAIVQVANALTLETFDTFYTPFYVMNYWKFRRNPKIHELKTEEIIEPAYKQEKSGQLVLF